MTTTNEAALKLARDLAAKVNERCFGDELVTTALRTGQYDDSSEVQIALAAILEVTERAAGLAKDRDGFDDVTGSIIAAALRRMEHLS